MMAALCGLALAHGIEPEHARRLVRVHRFPPPSRHAETAAEHWPYPIKIYALGGFRVVREGKPLAAAARSQSRPLALLKALVAEGARGVSASRIAEIVWPDEVAGDRPNRLEVNLHRLRKLLGSNAAVVSVDGRLGLDPASVWVDVWCFERVRRRAHDELVKALGAREAVALATTEKLLRLYRGPFLGGEAERAVYRGPDGLAAPPILPRLQASGGRVEDVPVGDVHRRNHHGREHQKAEPER